MIRHRRIKGFHKAQLSWCLSCFRIGTEQVCFREGELSWGCSHCGASKE